jgi:hypothetical protein
MTRLGFLHDPSTAQPFDYATLVGRVFPAGMELTAAGDVEAALFWGLAMLHGMYPDDLLALEVANGPSTDGSPRLDLDCPRLWFMLPRVGYSAGIEPGVRECPARLRKGLQELRSTQRWEFKVPLPRRCILRLDPPPATS